MNRPPAGEAATAAGAAARPDRSAAGAAARPDRTGAGGWLAYLIVLGFVAADLVWLWAGGAHAAKGGTLALAGAMFVAALARLVLPESRAGLLSYRGHDIHQLAGPANFEEIAGWPGGRLT